MVRPACEWKSNKDARFTLPPPKSDPVTGLLQMLPSPLIKISEACFPRESPPWTLGREIAFLLAGKGAYAEREIGGVYSSPTTGPLSSLYASAMFRYLNPEWSRRFARLGLYRTDVRFFRRDLDWLLSPECSRPAYR